MQSFSFAVIFERSYFVRALEQLFLKELQNNFGNNITFFAGRYDGFDCSSEIPEACSIDLLKNDVCDEETNTTLCAGDLGSCEPDLLGNFRFCLENSKLRGDGLCDMLNNMKECGFDNDDCVTNQGTYIQRGPSMAFY